MSKTLFIDLETTGLPPKETVPGKRPGTTKQQQVPYEIGFGQYPYIVSIAWKIDDKKTKHFIINQDGRNIPQEVIDIHGITDEMCAESKIKLSDVIVDLINDADGNDIVVGHGLYFDTSIIKANVLRAVEDKTMGEGVFEDISEILHKHKRIDTIRSCAKMMKGWKSLSELHQKIFHKGFETHNAEEDVEALSRCYEWLNKKGIVPTLEELQEKAKERELSNG